MKTKLLRRILISIPAILLQLVWLIVLGVWLTPYSFILNGIITLAAVIYVLYIVTSRDEGAYKTLWLLIILGLPIAGTVLYVLIGNKRTGRGVHKRLLHARQITPSLQFNDSVKSLEGENLRFSQTIKNLQNTTGFPLCYSEGAKFYESGEKMFESMLIDLESASRYIFIEYFIVERGFMWDSMVDILAKKASQGVKVYMLYDDLGSIATYDKTNVRALKKKGILCMPFNPMFFIRGTLNYRDHRKMLVIDGKIAYSGGVNLADEYINKIEKYGYWKDIGFRLVGKPVKNYVYMFLQFWNAFPSVPIDKGLVEECPDLSDSLTETVCADGKDLDAQKTSIDVQKTSVDAQKGQADDSLKAENGKGLVDNYLGINDAVLDEIDAFSCGRGGYVLSYYDSPLDHSDVSNDLYIDLLAQATNYAYFYTPYLMLGDNLLNAFINAAKRGVDVRIIMPGIPDKKLVYRMSRSYYQILLKSGIKIYEFLPGFVHAKACIIDDKICTIGTVNLDYRSLFLHFENNSLFYDSPILYSLKADFLKTQEKCRERKLSDIGQGAFKWFVDAILRIFAPLC